MTKFVKNCLLAGKYKANLLAYILHIELIMKLNKKEAIRQLISQTEGILFGN